MGVTGPERGVEGAVFAVTGATGRLGPHLCARLEALGARVLPLVLPGYPPLPRHTPWRAAAAPVEVSGAEDLDRLIRPDHVLNLHWRVDRQRPAPDQIVYELDANVRQPAHLWSWLAEAAPRSFVNCSSTAVFGPGAGPSLSSASEPRPRAPYGIAKLAGEHYLTATLASARTRVTHVRLGPVTSPGEHPTRLVSRLIASAFHGERITLAGGHRTSLLHVDEAVDWLIAAALGARTDRLLLVGHAMTVAEVARLFERVAGRPLDARIVDGEPEGPIFTPDVEPLRLPFVRDVPPEAAIRAMIEAARVTA